MDFSRKLKEVQSDAVYVFRGVWGKKMSGGWSLSILIVFYILDPQAINQPLILYALGKVTV